MFQVHSHLKKKWIFVKDLNTVSEMRQSQQLAYHVTKMSLVFSKIITNIDNINDLDFQEVIKLGKNHYSYGVKTTDFEVR